jgi:two-component system response regulator ResD
MSEAPARILVVEDDKTVSELVGTILDQDSYRVTVALNGTDALRLAREERPDLVVLDVLLPGISGFEVCQRLRQDPVHLFDSDLCFDRFGPDQRQGHGI